MIFYNHFKKKEFQNSNFGRRKNSKNPCQYQFSNKHNFNSKLLLYSKNSIFQKCILISVRAGRNNITVTEIWNFLRIIISALVQMIISRNNGRKRIIAMNCHKIGHFLFSSLRFCSKQVVI